LSFPWNRCKLFLQFSKLLKQSKELVRLTHSRRGGKLQLTKAAGPRHACEVLCTKGGCVGGSPIDAFKGLWSSWVRHLGAVSGGDSMTGSIKSPRARNPAARTTTAVASPTRPCVLRCPGVQAQVRKQQLSSLQVLVEAPRIYFSLPVLPSRDDTALQARSSSRRRR
jgi:hypothetical protein